jgi:hypothetical protein
LLTRKTEDERLRVTSLWLLFLVIVLNVSLYARTHFSILKYDYVVRAVALTESISTGITGIVTSNVTQ